MIMIPMCLLILQVAFISVGVWQVRQPAGFTQSVGVFNILINLVGGGLNVVNLFRS